MPATFGDGVPNRGTSERELDQWNRQMGQSPIYQDFIRRNGLDRQIGGWSRAQQEAFTRELERNGIRLPSGMHIDAGGNLNQSNHLVRNVAITAGITAAALLTGGAAMGAWGGAGGAGAGAGAGAAGAGAGTGAGLGATAAGAGVAGATGAGVGAGVAGAGLAGTASGIGAGAAGLGALGSIGGIAGGIGGAGAAGAGAAGAGAAGAAGAAAGGSGWVMPLLMGGQAVGQAASNYLGQRSNERMTRDQLQQQRELATQGLAAHESDADPYRHTNAQMQAIALLDRLANEQPRRINRPQDRYSRFMPTFEGGYSTSPDVRAAATALRDQIMGGGATAPSNTDPSNYGRYGTVDLLSLITGGGDRNGTMPQPSSVGGSGGFARSPGEVEGEPGPDGTINLQPRPTTAPGDVMTSTVPMGAPGGAMTSMPTGGQPPMFRPGNTGISGIGMGGQNPPDLGALSFLQDPNEVGTMPVGDRVRLDETAALAPRTRTPMPRRRTRARPSSSFGRLSFAA